MRIDLDKIKELRKKQKLSQKEFADLLGFRSVYQYNRKETGKQPFTALELRMIADHFNVPLEYFFDESVAKNAKKSTA
ncbi:hypothetical protein GCM10010965_12510 [Caldalkalibacillus thermarum]|uniref:helix-turn-helix domain-containing protein n=1 Tax=Caldalkalibacillus thermarum TaxID=296745 RepID=UPI001662B322|nr:helix-turn-helix transcriptional regulator [Caldalkalibacillus thermarum]GGK20913.1 hypothetical protein GCM10010965_12510 [Caldalkalibacillus thermarum]